MRSVKTLIAAVERHLIVIGSLCRRHGHHAPAMRYAPPPIEDFGGWYLRGDIGFSNQKVQRLNNVLDAGNLTSDQHLGFNTAGIFGLGVGYTFNNWFRADVTGEYRGNSNFFGTDAITYAGGVGVDTYHATKSEWVVLANAYVDLGTWYCITPFVGAGVGGARVSIANFTDQGLANNGGGALPGLAFGDNISKWNFAWAVHAGLAYKVSPNLTFELAYRYLDMGDGLTGDLRTFDGTNKVNNPTTFKHITSQDLKLGMRWQFETAPVYQPPLMRKG